MNEEVDSLLTKHFSKKELSCKCKRDDCDAVEMDKDFLDKLEKLRELMDIPLTPTSSVRCKFWNSFNNGAQRSMHIYGKACDFWFQDQIEKERFIRIAEFIGFNGIGVGSHLVHIDTRSKYSRWTYERM